MAGKQVFEVPSANVGGSLFSIAVCMRGMDVQKVRNIHFLTYLTFLSDYLIHKFVPIGSLFLSVSNHLVSNRL